MMRPVRVAYPGAIYHVTARGNGRAAVFEDDRDRRKFLGILERTAESRELHVHAYCLMGNHYHLLVETPRGNLSDAMRHLNGLYGQWFSKVHDRPGHVWGGRFKARLVEENRYLLAASRYIVRNPVEAGLVRAPQEWSWSSYRATVGNAPRPRYLNPGRTLELLDPAGGASAIRAYMRLVETPDADQEVEWIWPDPDLTPA
jgi:REP-associated tyrosine transposase